MRRFKKAGSLLSILMVLSVTVGTFPLQALAQTYTGELRLPNTTIVPDYLQSAGGAQVPMSRFNGKYVAGAPTFTARGNNNFIMSLPQTSFSASMRDGILNQDCTVDGISINPATNSIALFRIADDGSMSISLCSLAGVQPTIQNTTVTHNGSGNSYNGLGVIQTYDALPFATLGESTQNTIVESIPNDPNNVRVTISENVTQEAYGLHFERRGDVERVLAGDYRLWFPDNGLYQDGQTYIINWTSNWVGQVPINVGCDDESGYCNIIWGDPSTYSCDYETGTGSGRCTMDPLYVNTGYPTPQITQLASIAPQLVSRSVIRARNSDILSVTQPVCHYWTDGNFWRTVQHVYCLTDGLSADGRTGHAIYYNSVSSSGWFQEFLGVALMAAGLVTGAEFLTGFLGTVSTQMVAIQMAAELEGLVVSGSAFTNVVGDVLASQLTAGGVAASAANSAALSAISAFTVGSLAALSGPTALGTVETSNGMGVGDWVWSAAPVFVPDTIGTVHTCANGATDYPLCTPPVGTCANGASNYPVCLIIANICSNGATDYPTCTPPVGTCDAPFTQTVTVACDVNASGASSTSGSVTRSQTKSSYPACTFTSPVTVSNSTYVSDTCVYPAPPLSVSCSGAPGNPYINQPVTWSSSVTGGSGSYIYEWTGTDNLWDTVPTIQKSYSTAGTKQASLTVTDSVSNATASASCTTGANQSGGSASGGAGGTGVSVGSCTSSLSASPDTVEEGQNTSLSWSVSGGGACASSCSGSGFGTGGSISGTASPTTLPTPPTTTYSLTCTRGTYGPPPPANTTVTVLVPSVTTFTANDQSETARVTSGSGNVSIAWSAAGGATLSCNVTRTPTAVGWPKTGVSSPGITDTATSQTVYAIDCQNNYGVHSRQSVIVNVVPIYQEF